MPAVDLRGVERDEHGRIVKVEEGGGNVPSRSSSGNVPSRSFPSFPESIERRIWDAVASAPGGWMTRADIARALGLKKTTWLNAKITQMVTDGYLVTHQGTWKNGCAIYWYGVPQE